MQLTTFIFWFILKPNVENYSNFIFVPNLSAQLFLIFLLSYSTGGCTLLVRDESKLNDVAPNREESLAKTWNAIISWRLPLLSKGNQQEEKNARVTQTENAQKEVSEL
jgi:hypothetical protein